MKRYEAIFFDLDHTLWDFRTNARLTLSEMFDHFEMKKLGFKSVDQVVQEYERINEMLWAKYRAGMVDKASLRRERFGLLLNSAGITDETLSKKLNAHYMRECPQKQHLVDGAEDLLKTLAAGYQLHIISNGFRESQYIKLRNTGILPLFGEIILSEDVGYQKPQPEIFAEAIKRARIGKEAGIYIGDHIETDVKGALNFGMDVVHFNPDKIDHPVKATFEIHRLAELEHLLPVS